MKKAISATLMVMMLTGCGRGPRVAEVSSTNTVMDTFIQIKVSDGELSRNELKDIVDEAMWLAEKLDKKLSAFDPDSEVNQLNLDKQRRVSSDLFAVIKESKRISGITEGEFDITVAPMLKADGFYRNMPGELLDAIPDGTGGVDWRNVTLRLDGKSILLRKGAWIDLSGIAKGYIVDRVTGFLRKRGVDSILVNAGGDMYCGTKNGGPWRIGIRKPGGRSVTAALEVKDRAVATSGDYENVVTDAKSGRVISHIVDPRTGRPVGKTPSSVTVIAPTCAEADALATGMMAMGMEEAVLLADDLTGVEIIFITEEEGRRKVDLSSGAAKLMVKR